MTRIMISPPACARSQIVLARRDLKAFNRRLSAQVIERATGCRDRVDFYVLFRDGRPFF